MIEYINREDAVDAVCGWGKNELTEAILADIETLPAADARPVVLCRDCKYWFNAPTADGFNSCERDALIRHENFFCAAGEKREES